MQRMIGPGLLSVTGRRTGQAAFDTALSHRKTLWPTFVAIRNLKDLFWAELLARTCRWLPEAHITALGRSPGPDQDHVTSCPASIKAAVLLSQLLHRLVSGQHISCCAMLESVGCIASCASKQSLQLPSE